MLRISADSGVDYLAFLYFMPKGWFECVMALRIVGKVGLQTASEYTDEFSPGEKRCECLGVG